MTGILRQGLILIPSASLSYAAHVAATGVARAHVSDHSAQQVKEGLQQTVLNFVLLAPTRVCGACLAMPHRDIPCALLRCLCCCLQSVVKTAGLQSRATPAAGGGVGADRSARAAVVCEGSA